MSQDYKIEQHCNGVVTVIWEGRNGPEVKTFEGPSALEEAKDWAESNLHDLENR